MWTGPGLIIGRIVSGAAAGTGANRQAGQVQHIGRPGIGRTGPDGKPLVNRPETVSKAGASRQDRDGLLW